MLWGTSFKICFWVLGSYVYRGKYLSHSNGWYQEGRREERGEDRKKRKEHSSTILNNRVGGLCFFIVLLWTFFHQLVLAFNLSFKYIGFLSFNFLLWIFSYLYMKMYTKFPFTSFQNMDSLISFIPPSLPPTLMCYFKPKGNLKGYFKP